MVGIDALDNAGAPQRFGPAHVRGWTNSPVKEKRMHFL